MNSSGRLGAGGSASAAGPGLLPEKGHFDSGVVANSQYEERRCEPHQSFRSASFFCVLKHSNSISISVQTIPRREAPSICSRRCIARTRLFSTSWISTGMFATSRRRLRLNPLLLPMRRRERRERRRKQSSHSICSFLFCVEQTGIRVAKHSSRTGEWCQVGRRVAGSVIGWSVYPINSS